MSEPTSNELKERNKSIPENLVKELTGYLTETVDERERLERIGEIRLLLHSFSPLNHQPVDHVVWVPVEMVEPNDYNPNSVANIEMGLLYTSIKADGYTQPVVVIWDAKKRKYIIIDGFHRYFNTKNNKDIYEQNLGMLPVVILKKTIEERMASTVRHNRARGKHSIAGMSNLVFQMRSAGLTNAEVCSELGMEEEEVLRLQHITGFSKLFKNVSYQKAWKTKRQILQQKGYFEKLKESD